MSVGGTTRQLHFLSHFTKALILHPNVKRFILIKFGSSTRLKSPNLADDILKDYQSKVKECSYFSPIDPPLSGGQGYCQSPLPWYVIPLLT